LARPDGECPFLVLRFSLRGHRPGISKSLSRYDVLSDRHLKAFSPAKVIFAGFGVLLLVSPRFIGASHINDMVGQAVKDVNASQDVLADLFARIENFFKRLESYKEVPPTPAMTDMIVKIMVEVLSVLSIATAEIKRGRGSKHAVFPATCLSWLIRL
jgi:hypothetical protein